MAILSHEQRNMLQEIAETRNAAIREILQPRVEVLRSGSLEDIENTRGEMFQLTAEINRALGLGDFIGNDTTVMDIANKCVRDLCACLGDSTKNRDECWDTYNNCV